MRAFWMDSRRFETVGAAPVLDYDLWPASAEGEKSVLNLPAGSIGQEARGSWLLLEGDLFRIDSITPKTQDVRVGCLEAIAAFDRDIIYRAPAEGCSLGGFIGQMLEEEFRDQPDEAYGMPYLDIRVNDPTAFRAPETDSSGVFNLLEYMRMAAAIYNVRTGVRLGRGTLIVEVRYTPPALHSVVFDDGHHMLAKQAFGGGQTAKVTVLQGENSTDWYLAEDGSFGTAVPAQRGTGEWKLLSIPESMTAEEAEEKVRKTFAQNSTAHRIEFWSDREYAVGDELRIRLEGRVVQGRVDGVCRQAGDSRRYYVSGALATTLTEKLRGAGLK